MKSLQFLVATMVALFLFLSVGGLEVSADQKEKRRWGRWADNKDKAYEITSEVFSVDKKTLLDLENSLQGKGICDICFQDATKIIILARYRTDNLIAEKKFPQEKAEEVFQDSIKYFRDKRVKPQGYGKMAEEVGSTHRNLRLVDGTLYGSFYINDKRVKDLEKAGMSTGDAIKTLILAKLKGDRLIEGGNFTPAESEKAMEESVNYYKEKKLGGDGWGDLVKELDLTPRDFNKMASIIMIRDGYKI